jgi:hypothetical protein
MVRAVFSQTCMSNPTVTSILDQYVISLSPFSTRSSRKRRHGAAQEPPHIQVFLRASERPDLDRFQSAASLLFSLDEVETQFSSQRQLVGRQGNLSPSRPRWRLVPRQRLASTPRSRSNLFMYQLLQPWLCAKPRYSMSCSSCVEQPRPSSQTHSPSAVNPAESICILLESRACPQLLNRSRRQPTWVLYDPAALRMKPSRPPALALLTWSRVSAGSRRN